MRACTTTGGGEIMDPKAVFLSSMIALAAAQSGAMAQGTPAAGGVAAPPVSPMAPQDVLPGSEFGRYNDTYDDLGSFWGDDVISRFFKHVADGTLNQVTPLVDELCDKWRNRDPHLPVTGVISVPPGIEVDLNRLCR
jgi:hypothetical protein